MLRVFRVSTDKKTDLDPKGKAIWSLFSVFLQKKKSDLVPKKKSDLVPKKKMINTNRVS